MRAIPTSEGWLYLQIRSLAFNSLFRLFLEMHTCTVDQGSGASIIGRRPIQPESGLLADRHAKIFSDPLLISRESREIVLWWEG